MPLNVVYTAPVGETSVTWGNGLPAVPVAEFIGTPTTGTTPLAVTFTNQSTGAIDSYLWSFGDGTTSTTANPTKAYLTAASFSVALTATGPGGSNTKTRTGYVVASAPAPSPTPPPPPPAPAPSTGTPQPFALTSSGSGSLPFAIGYAMSQGHVPSGQSLSFSGATAKLTVLSTWPDGSARHGIIAGTYTSAGSAVTVTPTVATVTAGTVLTGAAVQTAMGANTAIIDAGAFGSATFSGSDFASPFKVHAATDGFIEAIYRKAIGSDAHLVAWLSLRVWSGGAVEMLPWVENGYLNVAGPTNKSATYSFTLGGTSRFSAAIDLPNHCRTPLLSGSALSHWLGTDPAVVPQHNAAYMQATQLVPKYSATVSAASSLVTGLPSTFAPLQLGSLPSGMGGAGYHASIGLLPQWDVLYLTSTASSVWAALQRNAYSAGRYGIHHRDETTNRPARFSSYPTTVLGAGNGISGIGSSSTSTFTPTATGTTPPTWNVSHHPSMGFMAYLVTGRFYHLETAQFAATANYLKSSDVPREGASGVMQTWSANTTRGAAWALRTLAQVAAITPDADVLRTDFVGSLEANFNRQHATYVATVGQNSYGWMEPFSDYTFASGTTGAGSTTTVVDLVSGVSNVDGRYVGYELQIGGEARTVTAFNGATKVATVSPAFSVGVVGVSFVLSDNIMFEATWMQDFYTASTGYAKSLKVATGTAATNLDAFFAWKAISAVGRLGGIGSTEYLYRDAAAYTIAIAKSDGSGTTIRDLGSVFRTGAGPWHASWGEIWTDTENDRALEANTAERVKEIGDGSLRGTLDFNAYWGNLQPALSYAVQHGVAGATAARAQMMSASNWAALNATGAAAPEWAVEPATTTVLAAAAASMVAGQWLQITSASVPGSGGSFFIDPVNPTTKISDYMHKAGYDPLLKQFRFYGQGHYGRLLQAVYDEAANAWAIVGSPPWYVDGVVGHGYSHNAIDPTTGDDYYRMYNDGTGVNRYNRAAATWSKTAAEPSPPTISGGLDYNPNIGASGGLSLIIGNAIQRWDKATNAWVTALSIPDHSTAAMSAYSHKDGIVFAGGGASASQAWYRVPPSGTPTAITNCPLSANATDKLAFCCPVSGDLLVMGSNTDCQKWNGTSWAAQSFSGAPSFTVTTGDGSIVAPIAAYGVTMILFAITGQVWLYKHA